MAVKRIVANIQAEKLDAAKAFYGDILDMDIVMDHGWIMTFASSRLVAPQISIATEGGAGTPVPDLSIEVDNLDEVYRRISNAGLVIEYGPVTEAWGVRRFIRARSFWTAGEYSHARLRANHAPTGAS